MLPPRRSRAAVAVARAALIAVAALAATGCRNRRTDDGSILDRIPIEADVVVMVRPAELAATWAASLAIAQARRIAVPDCVVARARAAPRVVIAWSHELPADGWLIAIPGGVDAACPDLAAHGAVAIWSRDLPPRTRDVDGFFDDRLRRGRWGRLPGLAIRGLVEHQLSAGIIAHADFSLDPRDGVDATAVIRFDSPDAAEGARARLDRWRGDLDAERMGGAWPAIDALDVDGPMRGDAALTLRLRLAGELGGTAASLLATALALGADRSDRAPCPPDAVAAAWRLRCQGGELRVPSRVREQLVQSGGLPFATDRMTTTMSAGAITGLRLTSIGAQSPLLALGLREGDWLQTVDGVTITSATGLAARASALEPGTTVTVALIRGGRTRTLRFTLE